LAALLAHPQNIVRHHARIELRKLGAAAGPALAAWVAAQPRTPPQFDQAHLEASWVLAATGAVRPAWISHVAGSADPLMRAAAAQLVRLTADHLPDALARLTQAAADPHPRVRMAAINAVAHLRPTRPEFDSVVAHLHPTEPAVQQMLTDLRAGTKPRKGRSVPVLEVSPATRVNHWLTLSATTTPEPAPAGKNAAKQKGKAPAATGGTYRTFVDVSAPQTAVLSVKHGYLDISVNGVQLASADSTYSTEQQVTFDLVPGLNPIEITYRRLRNVPPPVFVYDSLGQPLAGARFAADAAALTAQAAAWEKAHAADADALRVQAVPNQMQFAPRELRVRAGQPVRIVFENPDSMPHNFVLVARGAEEEVGLLADEMASDPTSLAKHFIPASPNVLHATPLVNPSARAELVFTAPMQPGRYPYLCTFPGHWRIMRGVLIVE
jgi:azurin